jgi:hypothetical protein
LKRLGLHYKKIAKEEMVRYLGEPINILAEPLGSAEPRLKNTVIYHETLHQFISHPSSRFLVQEYTTWKRL